MKTQYVIQLDKSYENVIVYVESEASDERQLYVGFDEGTHTTRHSLFRVDSNGKVYRNGDLELAEDKWIPTD